MKNIEIITAQNVILQYELADLKDRALAFLIDFIVMWVCFFIMLGIGAAVLAASETAVTIYTFVLFILMMFYSLIWELSNKGQSLGKMALRIRVIKVAGGQATFSDYAARWVFRMIDIYFSLGAIASILVASSQKGQRIGDVVANTAVIKTSSKMNLNLQDLLALHKKTNYTPQYPQARKLQEEDALLIKSTLDRHRKHDNDAHEEAIELLTLKVCELLDIDDVPMLRVKFLQTVLQDYVILSR